MATYSFAELSTAINQIMSSGKKLVYIAGASASGKTYIAEEIAKQIQEAGKKVLTISSDNYYVSDSGVKSVIYGTYDHPALIDYDLLAKNLQDYFTTGRFELPLYSFAESRRTGFETVDTQADIVIVEGLYTISQLPDEFDPLCIYIDAAEEDLIIRRLLRDPARVGEPLHMVVAALNNVFPMWHLYGDIQEKDADIAIFNDYDLLAKDGKTLYNEPLPQGLLDNKVLNYEEGVVEYKYEDSSDDENGYLLIREYYDGDLLKSVGILKTKLLEDGISRRNISMRIYKPGVLTQIHNLVQNAGLEYKGSEEFKHHRYLDENNKEYIVEIRNSGKFVKYDK